MKNYTREIKTMITKTLINKIITVFNNSYCVYGTRRIKYKLYTDFGLVVSKRRIGKLMKQANIAVKTRKKFKIKTTDSNHNLAISPNILNKNFTVDLPNKAYVGDITYIPTKEGFVYLSTVIDLYSRRLIGWHIDDNLKTQLIEKSLIMAKNKRNSLKNAIFHSDRGSQYASKEFRKLLKTFGMTQSMSSKGNCYDNTVAESFFHNLKTEFTFHVTFETREEAKRAIERYIAFYNSTRIHSYNNYKTPIEKELEFWSEKTIITV